MTLRDPLLPLIHLEPIQHAWAHGLFHIPDAVLFMPFEEGSGSTAHDWTKYGNHGTLYGPSWVAGKYGKALSFDGVNDYVEIPHSSSLNITPELTVIMWVNLEQIPSGSPIILYKLAAYGPLYTYLAESPNPYLMPYIYIGGVSRCSAAGSFFEYNKWYQIGFRVSYSSGTTTIANILNGEILNPATYSGQMDTSLNTLKIDWTYDVKGIIDEFRIYNRALTAWEIYLIYAGLG